MRAELPMRAREAAALPSPGPRWPDACFRAFCARFFGLQPSVVSLLGALALFALPARAQPTDRAVLVEFYNATDGANWTVNTNWTSDLPLDSWYGVTTNAAGQVTELSLDGNGLSGSIPAELGNLTSLTRLWLFDNELTGEIPAGFGSLSSLQWLDLQANELSGSIPVELGNLTSLQHLQLFGNELSGSIPVELGNLTSLQLLSLNDNGLTGEIPAALGSLSSLQWLDLHANELSGSIPAELGHLTSLQHLELSGNELGGSIPVELGNLTSLQSLSLNDNELTGEIPAEFGNLTSLQWLELHANELSGEIPWELGELADLATASLTVLSLYDNPELYDYPANLNARGYLHLIAPSDGQELCLPTTKGGTDCTIPTLVDNLNLTLGPTQIVVSWEPKPASPTPSGYEVEYTTVPGAIATLSGTTATITGLNPGQSYSVRVRTTGSSDPLRPDLRTPWLQTNVRLPPKRLRAAITTDAECSVPGGGLSGRQDDAPLCRAVTGQVVRFEDSSTGIATSRLWDFGDGQTGQSRLQEQSWSSPGFYEVTLRVSDGPVSSLASLTFLVEAAEPAGTCVADDQTLCLRNSRFAVEMDWTGGDGRSNPGQVVRAGTNDTGLFRFFGPDNWEALVKVLDGCGVNGHVWVFMASATDLGLELTVRDTEADLVRQYVKAPGEPSPAVADVAAFSDACEAPAHRPHISSRLSGSRNR